MERQRPQTLSRLRGKRILGLTPGDWVLYIVLFAAGAIPFLFDALPFLSQGKSISILFIRVAFLLGLVAMGYAYRCQVRSNRKEVEYELAETRARMAGLAIKQMLELALRNIEACDGLGDYRVNIMLMERGKLQILFHCRMNGASDFRIMLEKNQGCAGQAWGSGEQRCADLREAQEVRGNPSWNLTSEQEAMTRDLGAILSTPIFAPQDHQEIKGIFNVDSRHSLHDTCFLKEDVAAMAVDFANMFGAWLPDLQPFGRGQAE